MKQTAVEWFAEQLGITKGTLLEKAKAMEREQIICTYDDGTSERHNDPVIGEHYFKEMYGDHIGDVNEMIVPNWVYDNLCYYDLRNPNGVKDTLHEDFGYDKEEIAKIGNYARKGCACDNCFYRRSSMAEFIIKNHESI